MNISKNILNNTIPGESLTVKAGKYPYENPPLLNTASEAMDFIMDNYHNRNLDKEILKLIVAGVTIEYLANIIVKLGFVEGIFTVDAAEIIKPAVILQLLADARDAGVQDIRIFSDAEDTKIADEDFINIYKEFRGED
jgi:hypothetical protein